MRTIQVSTSSVNITLSDAATMAAGYIVNVHNASAGNITLKRATGGDTINGAAKNLTVGPQQNVRVRVNTAANGYLIENANPLLTDPTDPSKQAILSMASITTGTTRTFTFPDEANTIAGVASQNDVNAMTSTTRTITANANKIVLGTEVATTSGTTIDFTGIPSGVRRITMILIGVSTNGTANLGIQIGPSGGVETSGYTSAAFNIGNAAASNVGSSTSAFLLTATNAANTVWRIVATLVLEDASDFTWSITGTIYEPTNAVVGCFAGSKSAASEVTRIRLMNGSGDTFDAGVVNITYER